MVSEGFAQVNSKSIEGVYTMFEEVAGYSGETIELKGGRFRYWFYSDVAIAGKMGPKYPLTGTYQQTGNLIHLDYPDIYTKERTLEDINGVPVLLRDDALKDWRDEGRVGAYGVLIRVNDPIVGKKPPVRPSTSALYSKQMLEREKWEYESRYMNHPNPVRDVFRAWTPEGDPHLAKRRSCIREGRADLEPTLVRQLVDFSATTRSSMARHTGSWKTNVSGMFRF